MSIISMKEMLEEAKLNKYAVGQFNVLNLEWTIAVLKAAEICDSPMILGVSENAAKYMGGFKQVVDMVKNLYNYYEYSFDIAIHLDHGATFEVCKEAIDAGFTSVMIDASKLTIEENIKITKKVVDYAKNFNASVEAEVGIVGGSEDGVTGVIRYADEEECIRLCEETEIDFLAPALGSVHGFYHGEPKLGFDEMNAIAKKTDVPLVLHGGSGIDDEKIKKAIENGICKINVNTENQVAFKKQLSETIKGDALDPRKLLGPAYQAITNTVVEKIELFRN